MLIASLMGTMILAGCGDDDEKEATKEAVTETTTEEKEEPEAPEPAEEEAEPAEEDEEELEAQGMTFEDLQYNYSLLVDCYNQVEELYKNDAIAQDDDIESMLTEAKGLIDEMGELT